MCWVWAETSPWGHQEMQPPEFTNCWRSSDATGIGGFLNAFSESHRPLLVSRTELCACSCGNTVFSVDLACSATRITCSSCGISQEITPPIASWNTSVEESGDIDDYGCEDCPHKEFNVGIGQSSYSQSDSTQDVTWLNIGVRCCQCGLLACVNDYSLQPLPALPFDTTWLKELAMKLRPDLPWLATEIARCKFGTWTNACCIRFVNSDNANEPGADWQFRETIDLKDGRFGFVKLDVLKDNRIGGIEFYSRLFTSHLQR